MGKRAKCKLCNSIIESKRQYDCVACSCGEICIDSGSNYFHAQIKTDKSNLIMVDDEGNEIIPKDIGPLLEEPEIPRALAEETIESRKVSKEQLLEMLEEITKRVGELPKHVMMTPITHADYYSLLLLLSELFKSF